MMFAPRALCLVVVPLLLTGCTPVLSPPKDPAKNPELLHSLAERGDPAAQYNLGQFYMSEEDWGQAARWFRIAAEQGHPRAQYNLGYLLKERRVVGKTDREEIWWWERAAAQGHVLAQYSLGLAYQHGQNVPQDRIMAATWYRKAADQGHSAAQCNLGVLHLGEDEPAEAAKWFLLAAEQGDLTAQRNLAILQHHGQGVPKDDVEAHKWLDLASSKGDQAAREARDLMAAGMTPAEVAEAQRRARAFRPSSPNGG